MTLLEMEKSRGNCGISMAFCIGGKTFGYAKEAIIQIPEKFDPNSCFEKFGKEKREIKPKTIKEANDLIDRYIHFYNRERIQNRTGVVPLTLRHPA